MLLTHLWEQWVAGHDDHKAAEHGGGHHEGEGGEGVAEVEEARGEDLEHTAHNQNRPNVSDK